MATASVILLNRNGPLQGSRLYTTLYAYIILKIPVISSTWWPHRRFAFCQRQHFLQCQMGSRRKPLSSAATSALHIHPRASLILAPRPHTHSPAHTHTHKQKTHLSTRMAHAQKKVCTHIIRHINMYCIRSWRQAWRRARDRDLHLIQATSSKEVVNSLVYC